MIKAFIDSDFLVALNDASDSQYKRAIDILKKAANSSFRIYISINIFLETLTIISQKIGKKQSLALLRELRSGKYKIVYLDEKITIDAEKIFKSIKSKNVSYSDCVSFAVMKVYGIKWAFSFDKHFKKHGFKRAGLEGFPGSS